MKVETAVVLAVVLAVTLVGARAGASDWKVDIPDGVRYSEAPAEATQRVVAEIERAFANTGTGFTSDLFGSPVVCGPFLWNDIQIESPVENPPEKTVVFQIALGPVAMVMETKRFLSAETPSFVKSLRDYTRGQQFRVRPPTSDEIRKYWAMVPFDLEAPILMLESERFTFLLDFQGTSQIALIEQMRPGFDQIQLP